MLNICFFPGVILVLRWQTETGSDHWIGWLKAEGFKAANTYLDRLLAEGTYSLTTRPVMPSVTLPNWTSHLTAQDLKNMV